MSVNLNYRVPKKIEDEIIFDVDTVNLTLYYYNITIKSNSNYIEHVSKGEGAPVVQLIQGSSVEVLTLSLENRSDIKYGKGKMMHCMGTFSTSFNLFIHDSFDLKVIQQPLNINIDLSEKEINNTFDESYIDDDFQYYLDIPDKVLHIYNGDDVTKNFFLKFE